LLKDNMKKDPRVAVHLGEGWHVPRALLPVTEKRAVMLIDPPFEQLDELQRCAKAMKETITRMRQTVAAIWYPIKDDSRALKRFYQELTSSGAPKLLRVELLVHPLDTPQSLNGSGLVISNPPWGLEEELNELMPWLATLLGQSQGGWKVDWLIAE
jgi:23S rRNA (adenine2030-N6)-methyltransferase